jgi:hypothetical protein
MYISSTQDINPYTAKKSGAPSQGKSACLGMKKSTTRSNPKNA